MSFLGAPKPPGQNFFLGIQFQSSTYGQALPLLYGTQRISAQLVDYDDFQIIPNSSPVGKGGGVAVYSFTYLCGALLALCEGPIAGINRVWSNTSVQTLTQFSASMSGGVSLYLGTQPQVPWPYWATKHPNKGLGYAGIAYLGGGAWNLGSSATLPNNNFEVTGLFATEVDSGSRILLGTGNGSTANFYLLDPNGNYITSMATYPAASYFVNGVQVTSGFTVQPLGGAGAWALCFTTPPTNGAIIQWSTFLLALDAKPSAVLIDFLTSPIHGVPGWATGDIADNVTGPSSWQSYCSAMQFAVSPFYDSQKAAADWIKDLLTATNSEAVLHASATGFQLQVVPYGDTPVTGPVNSLVADGAFLIGGFYQIVSTGNTSWTSYGAASGNVGTVFQATSVGGAGSGLALPVLTSGTQQNAAASWTIGSTYMITALGSASNATWNTAMGTSGVTPVAGTVQTGATVATGGTVFVAANNGSACTGAVVVQVNLVRVNNAGKSVVGGVQQMGFFTPGLCYQITTMGTTTSAGWQKVGAIAGAGVGTLFQATSSGYGTVWGGNQALGTGTAQQVTLGASVTAVGAGSFSIGQVYQILALGTTPWAACGFVGTAFAGGIFTATTTGTGTGTANPIQVTLAGAPGTYAGSFAVGNTYQIANLGTTNWQAIGAAAGATVGTQFTATGVGSGTGSAVLCSTYTPNVTALYNLGYDDFTGAVEQHGEVTDDPAKVSRTATSETYNTIPVEFLDRQNAYNASTVQDPDPVNVSLYGATKGSSVSLHLITRMAHAMIISRIAAQRSCYLRRTFKFKTSWKYMLLEPMDLITITDPKIGLSLFMVRLTSVTFPEKDSEDGGIEIEAEEWPFGVGHAALPNPQGASQNWINTTADPGPVAIPLIVDVPAQYSVSGNPEILIAATGAGWAAGQGNPYWGGAEVWISVDGGASYQMAGQINGSCHYGTLMSNLTSAAPGTVAQVDFTVCNDSTTVQTASSPAANANQSALWINGEIADYTTVSLAGTAFQYNCTLAVRGAYETTPATASSGASVLALDGVPFRWQIPLNMIQVPLYFKLVSINLWGQNGLQTLANTIAYNHTPVLSYGPIGGSTNPIGGGNLLINSSFEISTATTGLADDYIVYDNSSGLEPITPTLNAAAPILFGATCQRLTWSVNNTTTKGLTSTTATHGFAWQPNTTYVLSVYARASGSNVGQTLGIYWNTAPSGITVLLDPPLSSTWQRYAWKITWGATVDTNFYLSIALASGTQGTLDFDGIQVEMGAVPTAYAPNANDPTIPANSIYYLTNQDKINLMQQYNAELALAYGGTGYSVVSPATGSLCAQANASGIAYTSGTLQYAYIVAVNQYVTAVTSGNQGSGSWTTYWPDGTTLVLSSGVTTTTLAASWALVVAARKVLENAIHLPVNGQTGVAALVQLLGTAQSTTTAQWAANQWTLTNASENTIAFGYKNPTLSISTSGPNGLQAPYTSAANTIYNVYAIGTGQGGTLALLAVPNGVSLVYPSGYSYSKLIGFYLTNASALIVPFIQNGADYAFIQPQLICGGTTTNNGTWNATAPTWSPLKQLVSVFLPTNTATYKIGGQQITGQMVSIATNVNYLGPQSTTYPSWGAAAITGDWLGGLQYYEFVADLTTLGIYVAFSGSSCYVWLYGCKLNL